MKHPSHAFAALIAFVALIGVLPATSSAQELNFGALEDTRPNMVHVNTGLEYAFVAGAGYSRIFRVFDRHLVVSGDIRLPYAALDFSDYRLKVGARAHLLGKKQVKLIGKVAPTVRGVENELVRLTNLGLDAGLVGGYYSRRWFVAGELGVDWAIMTKMTHSEKYRATIYENVKDGWYAPSGCSYYYGLLGGYSFSRGDIILRGGQARTRAFELQIIPFYVSLGVNVRFGSAMSGAVANETEPVGIQPASIAD